MTKALNFLSSLVLTTLLFSSINAWSSPRLIARKYLCLSHSDCAARFPLTRLNNAASATASSSPSGDNGESVVKSAKEVNWKKAKAEGGPFTFRTKYGALNPYAIYYGVTSIFLGLFWYAALLGLDLLYFLSRGRFDKRRRLVNFFSQMWGETLMRFVWARPKFEGRHILKEFYKKKQAAMFVANHNSWLDIPFIGATIGWRNYKLISKKELGKVPILGKAIKLGGHIMVDRTDRKSQVKTLREGINLLKVREKLVPDVRGFHFIQQSI